MQPKWSGCDFITYAIFTRSIGASEQSYDTSCSCTDNDEIRLLKLSASWSAADDRCITATCVERRCSCDFQVGYIRTRHGEPFSAALAASPVQAVLSHAFNLLWELPRQHV